MDTVETVKTVETEETVRLRRSEAEETVGCVKLRDFETELTVVPMD